MPSIDPGVQTGMLLGYARESTGAPPLESQIDDLVANGVTAARVYSDRTSADSPTGPRAGLAALLDYARSGDTVVVIGIDRLGRSAREVLATLRHLSDRTIGVHALRERLSTRDDAGATLVGVLTSLAVVNDEAAQGQPRKQSHPSRHGRGTLGRPRALTNEQIELAQRLRDRGDPVPTIAATLGVSRATLYRTLAEKRTAQ
ncbi:recombinase family protein [Gordonia sp. DT30]|uniref:recombinase family protein n=1 Tax=unclassified Gordonia (in: high G+C Gram-positive bacteria) TaxID=2657482 RepID=UPI003CF13EC1